MTTSPPKESAKGKGIKTDRQKRLSAALRENLRKRKSQNQMRQNSKPPIDVNPKP